MKELKSNRLHIGFFGKTNVGKSSVLNKITGQDVSIVSDVAGTTTDIVEKSMELLPIGPVNFLDTAGLNDETVLGKKRTDKALAVINRIDIGVIVSDVDVVDEYENELVNNFNRLEIPYLKIINKSDNFFGLKDNKIYTSALYDDDLVYRFKEEIIKLLPPEYVNPAKIVCDLLNPKDTVILVVPIDKEAPKGRLILPQVQTIRDLLDGNCLSYVVKESELNDALNNLKTSPKLVVTDSQAFSNVSRIVPEGIPLTSFSILFARLKGDLNAFIDGANAISTLRDDDKILILESCTHHAVDDDIGRVKIPNLLKKKTGKNLVIEHFSGHEFPDVSGYKLIIHCGACMTNRREVLSRIIIAQKMNIPITNYGIAISYCLGILPRATKIFYNNN